MKILLIEDEQDKKNNLVEVIQLTQTNDEKLIDYAENLSDARHLIIKNKYDLIIFDVYLPERDDLQKSVDVSEDILYEFNRSVNYQTESIAITKFEISDVENIESFNEMGVTVVHYDKDSTIWKDSLNLKISKLSDKASFDFLIFCALSKERDAFHKTDAEVGSKKIIKGLDCLDLTINGHKGLCIQPSRMGLVNMAITAAKAIEFFQPKIVAMSGICAGIKGETNFLDLIVGDICWEYQTGKYKGNQFVQEPYQIVLDNNIRTELNHFLDEQETILSIKSNLYSSELSESKILLGAISSGSAVVADKHKMEEIGFQHRKLKGIEMEMYSLYEAASQSLCKPVFFGAKAVVDLGDVHKDDDYHTPACILSARFVTNFISKKLS